MERRSGGTLWSQSLRLAIDPLSNLSFSSLSMYRLTARILLVFTLVGLFGPAALAVGAPAQHACCMRKPHGARQEPTIQSVPGPTGNCCPPIATAQWAAPSRPVVTRAWQQAEILVTRLLRLHGTIAVQSTGPARAPPAC